MGFRLLSVGTGLLGYFGGLFFLLVVVFPLSLSFFHGVPRCLQGARRLVDCRPSTFLGLLLRLLIHLGVDRLLLCDFDRFFQSYTMLFPVPHGL